MAIKLGIKKHEFWHMTPKEFEYHVDAHNEEMKQKQLIEEAHVKNSEYIAWLSGIYVMRAVGSVLGGRKAPKYPERPLTETPQDDLETIAKKNGLDVEEMKSELLLMTLEVDAVNARLSGSAIELGQTEEA